MAGEKLTKRVVDALKAPEPSKVGVKVRESFLWDRELRGFGVQVMPSGLKSFVIQYRTPEGRPRRVVIGRYGLMTVEEARTLAHEKLVAVSKGIDPVAEEAKCGGTPDRRRDLRLVHCRGRGGTHPWPAPTRHQGVHPGDGSKPDRGPHQAAARTSADRVAQARRHRGRAGRHRRWQDVESARRQPWWRHHRRRRRRGADYVDAARDLRACRASRPDRSQPRQGSPKAGSAAPRAAAQSRRDRAVGQDASRRRGRGGAPDWARRHPLPAAHRLPAHGRPGTGTRMAR